MADRTSRDDFNRAANDEPKRVQERRPPTPSAQVAAHGPHLAPRGHVHGEEVRQGHTAKMQADQEISDRGNGYDRKAQSPEKARIESLAKLFGKEMKGKDPSKAAQQAKDKDRERGDD